MLQKFRAMAPALLLIAGALVLLITPVGRAAAGVALLAAGLAFLLTPLCAALEKGLPRPLSAALCVILMAILLAGVAAAIVLPLVSQAGDMAARLTREMERAAAFLQKLRLPLGIAGSFQFEASGKHAGKNGAGGRPGGLLHRELCRPVREGRHGGGAGLLFSFGSKGAAFADGADDSAAVSGTGPALRRERPVGICFYICGDRPSSPCAWAGFRPWG